MGYLALTGPFQAQPSVDLLDLPLCPFQPGALHGSGWISVTQTAFGASCCTQLSIRLHLCSFGAVGSPAHALLSGHAWQLCPGVCRAWGACLVLLQAVGTGAVLLGRAGGGWCSQVWGRTVVFRMQ